MPKRLICPLLALAMWFTAHALLTGCAPPEPTRPNIVVVVLDTVRRDVTGCGDGESFTPRLDRLGREGTVFANAWTAAPWTPPSHGSIFTGLLPSSHGCTARSPRLSPNVVTLAERLGGAGYQTAAFHSNPWLTEEMTGLTRGFDVVRAETTIDMGIFGRTEQGGPQTVRNVKAWLDERDRGRPFFVFVNILEAHLPYDPPREYREFLLPDLPSDDRVGTDWANEFNAGLHPPESVDWDRVRQLYAVDAFTADGHLGAILDEIERRGLLENTVVIATSDHGENLGEHGYMDHQFGVFETLLAVPLVVSAPGRLASGRRDDPVLLTDIYATALDAAGVESSGAGTPSVSLLGEPSPADRPLVAEYSGPPDLLLDRLRALNPELDTSGMEVAHATVRAGPLRLEISPGTSPTLLDMTLPPEARTDLAEARPELVRQMLSLIPRVDPPEGGTPEIDEEMAEWLRSLGYM